MKPRKTRHIRRYLLAILLALTPLLIVPAATPAAATTFFYTGADMGMDANMGRSGNLLTWTNNSCSGGNSFNWYAGGAANLIDSMPVYPWTYAWNMSSIRNRTINCNHIWLRAANGQLWDQCLRPTAAIFNFGYPWNDNVIQVGLAWTGDCPS